MDAIWQLFATGLITAVLGAGAAWAALGPRDAPQTPSSSHAKLCKTAALCYQSNIVTNHETPLLFRFFVESAGQHTLGHLDCPACGENRERVMYSGLFGEYLVPEAARIWLANRKRLSPATRLHYEAYIRALEAFFSLLPVKDVHIGHIVAYQRARQAQIRQSKQFQASASGRSGHLDDSDGASSINHEISCVLAPVLRQAGLWATLAKFYEPLPLPDCETGMALTPEEEDHLFKVGRSRPRWMLAYCCDLITRNTTAGPGEIRHLRLKHIDLEGRVIQIEEGAKNNFRVRPLPLNDDALWAVHWLLGRYQHACRRFAIEPQPEHFLLFHRSSGGSGPDMLRPMGSWKKAHYAMRAEAAKKFPRLAHLRRYDLRHTACTDMMDNPAVSWSTIEHMMGHRVGSKTKRRYEHRRNASLRAAAEALDRGHCAGAVLEDPGPAPARKSPAASFTWAMTWNGRRQG